MSLAPVAPALSERLGVEVKFVDDAKAVSYTHLGRTQATLVVIHHEEAATPKGKKKKVVIAKELPFGCLLYTSPNVTEAGNPLRGVSCRIACAATGRDAG